MPPLSSTSSSRSAGGAFPPCTMLPCVALAFDEPSFFADLRVDINPTTPSVASSSLTVSASSPAPAGGVAGQQKEKLGEKERKHEPTAKSEIVDKSDETKDDAERRQSAAVDRVALEGRRQQADSCVWAHRMILAVHSPVFRSLLRESSGSRESREGVIDMRGPEHPPGRVAKCMLRMMYAAPGMAIDEIDKEAKLSDGRHPRKFVRFHGVSDPRIWFA